MKYKVILYNNGNAQSVDNAGNFSFYTKAQAIACASQWREIAVTSHGAFLWDGSDWTIYAPTP